MKKQKKYCIIRILTILLVVSLISPTAVFAAVPDEVQPLASNYLTSYTSYVGSVGGGKVQVWFRVTGTGYMADIGTTIIRLYESTDNENWTRVKTFLYEDYSNMLSHNDSHHMSYVEYQGVAGRYYKAYVCIWAGDETTGDARYMWTPVEQAT